MACLCRRLDREKVGRWVTQTPLTLQRPIAVMEDFEIGTDEDFLREFEAIFKRREECVAFDDPLDQREKEIGAQRQGLRINLRAATDEDPTGFVG